MRKALIIGLALALLGCGGPTVRDAEVVTATPAMVAICAPERGGIQGATAVAQRHCMAQGGNAEIVSRGGECVGRDGRATGSEFTYRCVR
jgi:putative hemolysin